MTLNRIQQIYTAKAEAFHLPRLDLKGSLLIGAMAAIIAFPTVVNAQELDLTLLPRGDSLSLHLTGTDYFEPLVNDELDGLRDYWD
ncbi:MAG: hypothetical protein U9N14_04355, partial [Pseudomonadota bacterium]|nr:hypothetical protein [Pseudomonadota bacterium]